jgi:hypothetical protein
VDFTHGVLEAVKMRLVDHWQYLTYDDIGKHWLLWAFPPEWGKEYTWGFTEINPRLFELPILSREPTENRWFRDGEEWVRDPAEPRGEA